MSREYTLVCRETDEPAALSTNGTVLKVTITFAAETDLAGCGSWDRSSGPPAMVKNGTGSYSVAIVRSCTLYSTTASVL